MPKSSRPHSSKRYPAHTRRGRRQRQAKRTKRQAKRGRRMEIRHTSRSLTAYGFFYPMALFLIEVLHLKDAFSRHISLTHRGKTFTVADFCMMLIVLPVLGIERISHIDDKLRGEETLAAMLGMTRFCCQKMLHTFLNRCSGWQVRQFSRINRDLINSRVQTVEQGLHPLEMRMVDIDASTRSTEGKKREKAKPGKNSKAKGRDSYVWSIATFSGLIIEQILDSGNVHCKRHLQPLLRKVAGILSRIDLLRIDGGYLLGVADLNFLLLRPYAFITKVKANLNSVQEAIAKANRQDWQRVDKSTAVLDAGRILLFGGALAPVRLVVVRAQRRVKRTKKGRVYYQTKTIYWGLVTDLEGDTFFFQGKARKLSALWLHRLYKKRWTIENTFKAMHQAFNTGKLPSHCFRANQCYLACMGLAYNATVLFQRHLLTKETQRWTWSTTRRRLLCVPALVEVTEDAVVMTFHSDFPYKKLHRLVVVRLIQLLAEEEAASQKWRTGQSEQPDENQIVIKKAA